MQTRHESHLFVAVVLRGSRSKWQATWIRCHKFNCIAIVDYIYTRRIKARILSSSHALKSHIFAQVFVSSLLEPKPNVFAAQHFLHWDNQSHAKKMQRDVPRVQTPDPTKLILRTEEHIYSTAPHATAANRNLTLCTYAQNASILV